MALSAAAAPATSPTPADWIPVGVTSARLRVFVERPSVRPAGNLRTARMHIGAPRPIAGWVALAYQTDEIGCSVRQWRMTAFEAFDDVGRLVQHRERIDAPMRDAIPNTIGGEILATVCAL